MSKTALKEAMKLLNEEEQEAVRKLWREQKRIEREMRKYRRKHIFYVSDM